MAAIGLFVGYSYYSAPGPLATAKTFEIKRGLRTSEIAVALQDAGIVSDAALFSAAASLTDTRGKLRAGEYDFPAGVSVKDALNIIVWRQGENLQDSDPGRLHRRAGAGTN